MRFAAQLARICGAHVDKAARAAPAAIVVGNCRMQPQAKFFAFAAGADASAIACCTVACGAVAFGAVAVATSAAVRNSTGARAWKFPRGLIGVAATVAAIGECGCASFHNWPLRKKQKRCLAQVA